MVVHLCNVGTNFCDVGKIFCDVWGLSVMVDMDFGVFVVVGNDVGANIEAVWGGGKRGEW